MPKTIKIIVKNQEARFIHTDTLSGLFKLGTTEIKRASYVEPIEGTSTWSVDLSPVGGPILGPFTIRAEALASEVEWLENHNIPLPK